MDKYVCSYVFSLIRIRRFRLIKADFETVDTCFHFIHSLTDLSPNYRKLLDLCNVQSTPFSCLSTLFSSYTHLLHSEPERFLHLTQKKCSQTTDLQHITLSHRCIKPAAALKPFPCKK